MKAEVKLQQDEGWVAALNLIKKLVNYSRLANMVVSPAACLIS